MPRVRTGQDVSAEGVATEVAADEVTLIYDPQPNASLSADVPAGTTLKVPAYAVQAYLDSGAFKRSE